LQIKNQLINQKRSDIVTEVNKICFDCKNCKKAKSTKNYLEIACAVHDATLTFPDGSTPTCDKWEEKDPTLAELRDEVRELKKQIKEHKCIKIIDGHLCCEDDCCKCKCRCNHYWYPYWTLDCSDYTYIPTITTTSSGGTFTSTWK
jgi:hypothetical protein